MSVNRECPEKTAWMHMLIWAFPVCMWQQNYGMFSHIAHHMSSVYGWLSLSQIITYLEVKIWSLFKHENLTTSNKILWKRGEITPKEQFLLFSTIFMPPTSKKLEGHIASGTFLLPKLRRSWRGILLLGCLCICPSVRACVRYTFWCRA